MAKKDKTKKRKAKLARAACSWRWAVDVEHSTDPVYPHEKMPLSTKRTYNAVTGADDNYNPRGERGEQRHTPAQCVAVEDALDGMTPKEAEAYEHPSSAGACVDVRGIKGL